MARAQASTFALASSDPAIGDDRVDNADKDGVERRLGLGSHGRARTWRFVGGLLVASVLAGAGWWQVAHRPVPAPTWETQAAIRGDLDETVDATGTLEPRVEVTVGAEISGRIATVLVEEDQRVEAGQVLARFDLETFESELAEARASLSAARADVRRAEANLQQTKNEARRTQALRERGLVSVEELETRESSLALAEADLARARAQSALASARVEQIRTKIGKAEVTSPIAGVVLRRGIEPGSTVAASFQTPELFTIAADLTQMQLELEIDEGDVGRVAPGQPATFTVSAWPSARFDASVTRIALAPTKNGNVVSYVASLAVDNPDGRLRPGMTATATIETGTRRDVLLIPTSALRFNPPRPDEGGGFSLGPPRGRATRHATGSAVWVLRGAEAMRVAVTTGASKAGWTEVVEGAIDAGDAIIVGTGDGAAVS